MVELMANANEYERGKEHVDDGKAGQQHEYAVRVRGKPYVIGAHEQLEWYLAEPTKNVAVRFFETFDGVFENKIWNDLKLNDQF